MPTEEHDYTHKDIWVALTVLSGRIDTLPKDVTWDEAIPDGGNA